MPSYAYRGYDFLGNYLRLATEATNAQEVMEQAQKSRHHVIMLYRLEQYPQRYIRLMELVNILPPTWLTKKQLKTCTYNQIKNLRPAIRNKVLEGRTGLFHTTVKTNSLIEKSMKHLREYIFAAPLAQMAHFSMQTARKEKSDISEVHAQFMNLPFHKIAKDYTPPEILRKWILPEIAEIYEIVPYKLLGETLLIIAKDPEYLDLLEDLPLEIGKQVEFVRCATTLKEHKVTTQNILSRYMELESTQNSNDYELEYWEGIRKGLPGLPIEKEQDAGFPTSRIGIFLREVAPLLLECDVSGPIISQLILNEIKTNKSSGLRLQAITKKKYRLEYFNGRKFIPTDDQYSVNEVIILAAAVGIHPLMLPPVSSTIEWQSGNKKLSVTGKTSFSEYGEQIELHWKIL